MSTFMKCTMSFLIPSTTKHLSPISTRVLASSPITYKSLCSSVNSQPHSITSGVYHTRFLTTKPSSNLQKDSSLTIQTISSDGVLATPIDFDTASKIEASESQIVTISLSPDQVLRAESSVMMYMTEGVTMNTTSGGGLSVGFKRILTGQDIFISDYSYHGPEGTKGLVCLGTDFPSNIVKLNVNETGGRYSVRRGHCCVRRIRLISKWNLKKFSTDFFGGEGFALQSLVGGGDVFVKTGGTLIRRDLDEGKSLRISSGTLVTFSNGVDFGYKNVLFGGEGLFVTTLTGPGTVWLQEQPPQRMISEIARRVPSGGLGLAVPIGGGGGCGGCCGGSEAKGGEGNETP